MHIILKNNFLNFQNYKLRCSIGKSGISSNKKEGDFKTPKGIFKFKYVLYRKDRITNFYSKLKKITFATSIALPPPKPITKSNFLFLQIL